MYRAILFDLYDTVVRFHPRVPTVQVADTHGRSTMGWMADAVAHELPGVDFGTFVRTITEVSAEIIRDRAPEYVEVPSPERFRRALVRLGVPEDGLLAKAERLTRAHMHHLASAVELPPEHLALLRGLATRYSLGLVSNFDHGPTAWEILTRHELTGLFASIVISDGFGRRKPHPTIFTEALRQLGVAAAEAVFVGDSAVDDIAGAHGAGLDTVWINWRGTPLPEGVPPPTHTIARFVELAAVLGPA